MEEVKNIMSESSSIKRKCNNKKGKNCKRDIECSVKNNIYNNIETLDCTESLPRLLLQYSYFLDARHVKLVSIGYNNDTFTPTILFHHVGKSYIELNAIDWMSIFLNIDNINKYYFTVTSKENGEQNDSMKKPNTIKFMTTENFSITPCMEQTSSLTTLLFQQHCQQQQQEQIRIFTLDHTEWLRLHELMDFFNTLIFYYKSTVDNVKHYYNEYVKKCVEYNKLKLIGVDFFTPQHINHYSYNYSRLFYETPIICHDKLYYDICYFNVKNQLATITS